MSTMTGVVPGACPAGVTHAISLALRLKEQYKKRWQARTEEKDITWSVRASESMGFLQQERRSYKKIEGQGTKAGWRIFF